MKGHPTGAASTGSRAARASSPTMDLGSLMKSLTDIMQRQMQEAAQYAMRMADVAMSARQGPLGASAPGGVGATGQEGGEGAGGEDGTALVSPEALRAWGVFVQLAGSLLQQQGLEVDRLLRAGMDGTLGADALVGYGVRTWSQGAGAWLGAGRALAAAGSGPAGPIPSLVFYIDDDSEVAPAQAIPFRGPRGTEILPTDVVRIGGPLCAASEEAGAEDAPGILRAHGEKAVVECRYCVERAQLEVSLVGLSGMNLEPGLYNGMVFSRVPGEARRVPQAQIWVYAALKEPRSSMRRPSVARRPAPAGEPDASVH